MRKLVFIFCFLMMLVSSAHANAQCYVLYKSNVSSVKCGDEIEYVISLKNAEEIVKMQMTAVYDTKRLEYVSQKKLVSNAPVLRVVPENEKLGIAAVIKTPLSGDSDIVSLRFKVKENAPPGAIKFEMSSTRAGKDSDNITPSVDNMCGSGAKVVYKYTADNPKIKDNALCVSMKVTQKCEKAAMLVCAYRGGKFVGFKQKDVSGIIGDTEITCDLPNGTLPSDKIKIFVWNIDSVFPLSETVSIYNV